MGFLVFISFSIAWAVAFTLAKKWKRGRVAFLAALIGVVASWVATIALAILLNAINEFVFPADYVLLRAITFSFWSFLISPIAAFVGWKKAKASALSVNVS